MYQFRQAHNQIPSDWNVQLIWASLDVWGIGFRNFGSRKWKWQKRFWAGTHSWRKLLRRYLKRRKAMRKVQRKRTFDQKSVASFGIGAHCYEVPLGILPGRFAGQWMSLSQNFCLRWSCNYLSSPKKSLSIVKCSQINIKVELGAVVYRLTI